MTNRLVGETSPYLLQHADNPVDWYPWGKEALNRAQAEDKPIFLSIGYSACHWCHVMAHECFENNEIARLMNENFVNIKVDREERPDLDTVYMEAVQSLLSVRESMSRYPLGFGNWLCALDFYLSQPKEIAIIGPRNDRATLELLHTLCTMWLPNKVVAAHDPNDPAPVTELKLLENRQMINNYPTVYVCEHYSCQAPVTDGASLSAQLRGI